MADFSVVFDPMLDKERAEFDNGSGGSGGSSYVGGERINIAGGTISFVNSADIVNVTGTSVTLQPDTAYKIYATSQAITLNANPPAAGKWAYEGHLEIFVAGTGYVVTGTNVVLANALEPDSVNNCTVRFHDGIAIIAVEDHVAGYIVVNGSTAGSGSLYYGITTSTNDYVAFDATLNGQSIPLAGATAEGEKHVVGNGYTETAITGAVNCGTSKFTVANLALSDVQVTGGTMTLGDAFIPSGSTVAVSGGGLAIEKVSGNGGVIDLGGTSIYVPNSSTASASGCTFSGGRTLREGGAFYAMGSTNLESCIFIGNNANGGAACYFTSGGVAHITSCNITGNGNATCYGAVTVTSGAKLTLENSVISGNTFLTGTGDINVYTPNGECLMNGGNNVGKAVVGESGKISLSGSNSIIQISSRSSDSIGSVTLTSGAILDLTGNTNATPINPGGGVTFAPGGATVYPSAGSASAFFIAGATVASLDNAGGVSLGTIYTVISNQTQTFSGCTLSSGGTSGAISYRLNENCNVNFHSCKISLTGKILCAAESGDNVSLYGTCNIRSGLATWGTSTITVQDGAVLDFTDYDSATFGNSVLAGIVVVGNSVTVIDVSGTTHTIAAGTYTQIKQDGTTVPAQK